MEGNKAKELKNWNLRSPNIAMEDVHSNKKFHLVRGFPIGMLDKTGGTVQIRVALRILGPEVLIFWTWDPGTEM